MVHSLVAALDSRVRRPGQKERGPYGTIMSESKDLSFGTVLADRYELTGEVGRGGFGMVYKARQLNMSRDVAIKVLPPKFMAMPDLVARFQREAQLASRLRHPNTITVHDYGQHENLLFIVMELLSGEDLADRLKREKRIELDRIVVIAKQVLRSLQEAHEHGIVHRDLKPENIFLSRMVDEPDFVKVLDFGIAKLAEPKHGADVDENNRQLTMMGSTVGTPTYMSPEQAAGEDVDSQTDLYALGIILYEMANGRPPFADRNPVKTMRAHLFDPVPPFSNEALRNTPFEALCIKALQKDRGDRFKTAAEFLAALDQELLTAPVSSAAGKARKHVDDDAPTIEVVDAGLGEVVSDDSLATSDTGDPLDAVLSNIPLFSTRSKNASLVSGKRTEDAIPFGSSGNAPREPVRSGASRSNLTEGSDLGLALESRPELDLPPPGFEASRTSSTSSTSSILTVVEEPQPFEEEIIVLTRPKRVEQPTPVPETPLPVESPPAKEGTRNDSEWVWGAPGTEAGADSSQELRALARGTTPTLPIVIALLVLVALGVAGAWMMGYIEF